MDPISMTLMAASMLTTAGGGLFSAGSQARAGERTSRLGVWQALQESAIGFREAGITSEALVDQFMDESQATLDQALRGTKAYTLAIDMARKNAARALSSANFEENRVREGTDATLATQGAYWASANLDPSYGSPLALAAMGAAQGEVDARIVRAGGAQEAAEQEWTAYGLADRAAEGVDAARTSTRLSAKAVTRDVNSAFRTAGIKGQGGNTAATIAALTARKAGAYGAASTLLTTGSNLFKMGAGMSGGK